jgi:16S rRNA (guanine966-N2)-methyltransferase
MRIVGGRFRRRQIVVPSGRATRPTSDRARQALFDMLMHAPWAEGDIIGATVLDAFAGTGALGLEALSRGAGTAHFIERDAKALAALRRNIATFGVEAVCHVVPGDATRPPPGSACGLVFLDPPYGKELVPKALGALITQGWIAANALIVVEVGIDDQLTLNVAPLDDRRYGAARVVVCRATPQ